MLLLRNMEYAGVALCLSLFVSDLGLTGFFLVLGCLNFVVKACRDGVNVLALAEKVGFVRVVAVAAVAVAVRAATVIAVLIIVEVICAAAAAAVAAEVVCTVAVTVDLVIIILVEVVVRVGISDRAVDAGAVVAAAGRALSC